MSVRKVSRSLWLVLSISVRVSGWKGRSRASKRGSGRRSMRRLPTMGFTAVSLACQMRLARGAALRGMLLLMSSESCSSSWAPLGPGPGDAAAVAGHGSSRAGE
jgi:hypothetical protein